MPRLVELGDDRRPPLLRRFVGWYLGEFVDQVAGRPATPWDGPLTMP